MTHAYFYSRTAETSEFLHTPGYLGRHRGPTPWEKLAQSYRQLGLGYAVGQALTPGLQKFAAALAGLKEVDGS